MHIMKNVEIKLSKEHTVKQQKLEATKIAKGLERLRGK